MLAATEDGGDEFGQLIGGARQRGEIWFREKATKLRRVVAEKVGQSLVEVTEASPARSGTVVSSGEGI